MSTPSPSRTRIAISPGRSRAAVALGAALVLAGCGGPGPNDIVTPRKVAEAGGAPVISAVVDMGDFGRVPERGALPAPDSDGAFTIGERILIQGKNFGKQPTISIGGRPATTLARTGSGAIVTQIPTGIRTGTTQIKVSNPRGGGESSISVKRYAFVVRPDSGDGGQVHVLELSATGRVTPGAAIDLPGARDVAFSADGQIALVAAAAAGGKETARLALIAVGASGGPRLVHELRLTGTRADAIVSARAGGVAAIVADAKIILADVREPRYPANHPELDLGLDGDPAVTALALNPEGTTLAALVADGNRLVPIDVSAPATPKLGAPVALLPNERVPLARALGYGPEGQRLYVVAGDSREALSAGSHPTRVLELSAAPGAAPSVTRTAEVAIAGAPTSLAVSPRDPNAGSTAVRAGDDAAPLAMTAIDRAHLSAGAKEGAEDSRIIAAVLAGTSAERAGDKGIITDIVFSHDLRYTLSAVVRGVGATRELGVLTLGSRSAKPAYTKLGEFSADPATLPAAVAVSQ